MAKTKAKIDFKMTFINFSNIDILFNNKTMF